MFSVDPLVGVNLSRIDLAAVVNSESINAFPGGTRVKLSDNREAVYGLALTIAIPADTATCDVGDDGSTIPIGGTYLSPSVEVPQGYGAWFIQDNPV
jgi:hypothetical protein